MAATPADQAPAPEPAGYWSGPINSAVPATLAGGAVLDAAGLQALLAQGAAVLIDAADLPHQPPQLAPGAVWLPPPHAAIPGATWLPGIGHAVLEPEPDAALRRRIAALTGGDTSRRVVVYCHERCWLSWNGAKRILSYGYRQVYWFPAGIEGWRAASQPTVVVEAQPAD